MSRALQRRAARHFSHGRAFELVVKRVEPAHASDLGKRWRVYALGEDRFEHA